MSKSFLPWLVGVTFLLGNPVCLVGCSSWKATDNTKAIEYLTRGEEHAQTMQIPGELLGPQFAGKVFVVASTPGKDVELSTYYPDGSKQMTLHTSRSATLDRLFAGALGLNEAAFAQGNREWDNTMRLIEFIVATAKEAGYLQRPVQAPAQQAGSGFDTKLSAVESRLVALEGLLSRLAGQQGGSSPQ